MPLPQIKALVMRRTVSLVFLLFAASLLTADPLGFFTGLAKRDTRVPAVAIDQATADQRHATAGKYGQLPLSFERNQGQFDPRVRFKARGLNYALFLTGEEAVFALGSIKNEESAPNLARLRMKLLGADGKAEVSGSDELPGKVNYFIGSDPDKWRKNVSTYSQVRYRNVYAGIDLIYHGNQQQLEYDFVIAPGASPRRIRIAFNGANKITIDREGNLILSTPAGDVRQKKPIAFQLINGERREVPVQYRLKNKQVGFETGTYDKNHPLTIDPVLVYSTYLGGSSTEQGLAIAVDSGGSAYITGNTFSTDFPLAGAFQNVKNVSTDAYVVKLNPAGNSLVYATYLGGNLDDNAFGIAVDAQGSAYVVGGASGSFPVTPGVVQDTKDGSADAFITKLSPDGASLNYSTLLGGDNVELALGVAVDNSGRAYVVGRSDSTRFRTFTFPSPRNGSPVYKSTNNAGQWSPGSTGLTASIVLGLTIDPSNSNTLYAATNYGVFKTIDAGGNWLVTGASSPANAQFIGNAVAVDPSNSSNVYVATFNGVYKSTDGGASYLLKGSPFVSVSFAIAIDPITPTTVYAGTLSNPWKSTNGGDTWVQINSGITSNVRVNDFAIDPTNTAILYIATNRGLYKSTNGGTSWSALNPNFSFFTFNALAIDPLNPLTVYAGGSSSNGPLYKSTDGGATWSLIVNGLSYMFGGVTFRPSINAIAVDPVTPSTIYLAASNGALFKSTDAGANWNPSRTNFPNFGASDVVVDRNNPAIVYASTSIGSDVFATRLNSSGSTIDYFLNFGGHENDEALGVAVDTDNTAYVVGTTTSENYPVVGAFQSASGGPSDVFVSKLDANGSGFVYSTYLGGNSTDTGRSIAVRNGSAIVVGQTSSTDFPLLNSLKPAPTNFASDAFVTKLNTSGSSLDFSTCLGGASTDGGLGLALDSAGMIYVTGVTSSDDFPVVVATQPTRGGVTDGFITKLDGAGPTVLFSTYLGGTGQDQGNGIAVSPTGNAHVVGTTSSSSFPTVSPFQSTLKGTTDAFVTKIGPSLEMGVTMVDAPDPVNFGSDLTYTITVRNNGEEPASGVTLTDSLPSGATFVSVSTTRGSCTGTATIVCSLGTMNGSEQATIQIVIKPPAVSSISNTATVTLNEVDPIPANNSATAQTQVDFADLLITGATGSGRVAPNGRINYLFTVKNLSGRTATSVTFTDNLPAGMTFVSCSAEGGVCGGSGNNRTVTFTSLAVGQSAAIVIVATVDAGVAEGTILSNTATVSSSIPDSNAANNSATATVTVTNTPLFKKSNGLIAFATSRIFTVKADGSELPVQFPAPGAISPRWSPDGAKLAFSRSQNQPTFPFGTINTIEVVNADGTGSITLADNAVNLSFNDRSTLSWSPDGTRVAYVGTDRFIYLANADGSGHTKLPNSPSQIRDIDWSADGSRFVFAKDSGEIYVMNVDGSGLTKLVALGTSPDGPTHYLRPSWSPDMSRILFSEVSNNNADVFIMNSDGTGRQRLLNHPFTFGPTWSPDGARLAFYNGTELFVTDIDGTDELRLATAQDCCNFGSISWQPIPTTVPLPPAGVPSPTFTISGHVSTNFGGNGSAIIKLSGTRAGSIGTDANGNYSIVNLPLGGTYTITPTSVFFKFDPPSRTFTNLQANETGADFVATSTSHTVRGRLTNTLGQGLSAQPLVLTRFGSQSKNTITDAQGFYSFTNVFPGDGYGVIPQSTGFTFDPGFGGLPPVFSDMTLNFVGAASATVRLIGGRITDPNGRPLAGHVVTLSGARNAVVKTDVDGFFRFINLPIGQNYLVTPSTTGGFVFFTPPASFPNLTDNESVHFTATIVLPSVQFSAPSYTVSESGRAVEITVTRTGILSASGTVDYETSDFTASERTDYTAAFGTLRFGPGESTRSFTVLVSDDVFVEGARNCYITLLRGTGVVLGANTVATLIIMDDDVVASAQNPIEDAAFFVRQHYADFLNRAPDDAGLDFWTNQITSCGADVACREIRRINVSAAFFLSIEFQETGYLVYRIHHAAFGTAERLRIKTFLRDTQEIGRGVVVGVGNWQEQLEANKRAFMDDLVLKQEFTNQYPLSMSAAQFVDMLNANAGGALSVAERDALVADLTSNTKTRGEVLRAVAENGVFSDAHKNRAFVLMQYFGYLRRNPNDPPNSDFSGHAFWLGKLNQFNGNFVDAEMVKAFLVSGEYRQRFGAP